MYTIIRLIIIAMAIQPVTIFAQATTAARSSATTVQPTQNTTAGGRASTSGSATITTDPITNVPTITLINPTNRNPVRRAPVVIDPSATATPPAQTVGSSAVPNAAAARSEFDAVDSDGDGAISWDEFTRAGSSVGFTAIDQNGDLKISPGEWRNYMRRRAAE